MRNLFTSLFVAVIAGATSIPCFSSADPIETGRYLQQTLLGRIVNQLDLFSAADCARESQLLEVQLKAISRCGNTDFSSELPFVRTFTVPIANIEIDVRFRTQELCEFAERSNDETRFPTKQKCALRGIAQTTLRNETRAINSQTSPEVGIQEIEKSTTGFFGLLFSKSPTYKPLGTNLLRPSDIKSLLPLNVGDRWEWVKREVNFGNKLVRSMEITNISTDRINIVTQENQKRYFTKDWSYVKPDLARFNDFLKFPIQQGATWQNKFATNSDSGEKWHFDDAYEVVGEESVSVPAGVFDCVVIRRVRYSRPNIAPPGFNPISQWTTSTTVWYAPKAKNFVKTYERRSSGQQNEEFDEVLTQIKLR